jgi:hypothetical protein
VLKKIAEGVIDNALSVEVITDLFGDPAPGNYSGRMTAS